MANPTLAWTASLNAGQFLSHGQSLTVTVNITNGLEVQVPFGARYGSNISMPVGVFVYPSSDGGANFDTEPMVAFGINAVASVVKQISVRLPTGQYAVQMTASSPSVTVFVLTQQIITTIT
jgi:hypothetical protein